jgi:hypothetical protein
MASTKEKYLIRARNGQVLISNLTMNKALKTIKELEKKHPEDNFKIECYTAGLYGKKVIQ